MQKQYSFQQHYDQVLSKYYTRIFGGRELNEKKFQQVLDTFGIRPEANTNAIDLGAGSGFATVPLAKSGCKVFAVDLDQNLLDEIQKLQQENISVIHGDILKFPDHVQDIKYDLILCLTDVISHLKSYDQIRELFTNVERYLTDKGRFLLSYRDQTKDLEGTDRFIPFYSDDEIIITTFLEHSNGYLDVTDIFNVRENGNWTLVPGTYRKLRLYTDKIQEILSDAGLTVMEQKTINGMSYILCRSEVPLNEPVYSC